jgi:hypothetical protein
MASRPPEVLLRQERGTRSCLLVRGSRLSPTQHLQQAPGRDQRPDTLQQQEAELLLIPGEDGKDRGAKQVEDQVEARVLIEHPELGGHVSGEDQQGAGYLNHLVDRPSYEGRPRAAASTASARCIHGGGVTSQAQRAARRRAGSATRLRGSPRERAVRTGRARDACDHGRGGLGAAQLTTSRERLALMRAYLQQLEPREVARLLELSEARARHEVLKRLAQLDGLGHR